MKNLSLNAKYEDKFVFVSINALNLQNPDAIYQQLLERITNIRNIGRTKACLVLNEIFNKGVIPDNFKREYTLKK